MSELKINRDLGSDPKKSGNYSGRELKKGDIVHTFSGTTYGVIGSSGIAVTDNKNGKGPFYEVPKDAVD